MSIVIYEIKRLQYQLISQPMNAILKGVQCDCWILHHSVFINLFTYLNIKWQFARMVDTSLAW